jgi:hypothetical protein
VSFGEGYSKTEYFVEIKALWEELILLVAAVLVEHVSCRFEEAVGPEVPIHKLKKT